MQLASSIITAVSTLFAVGITLFFTNRRERSKFILDLNLKEYIDLETFYINLLSSIEKAKSYTTQGEDYKELFNEISILSAKANLISTDLINRQLNAVSDVLYEWSSLYRKSLPTKVGNTGLGIVSNIDLEFRDRANELYPKLFDEIQELVKLIKQELNNQKKKLKR